MYTGYQPMRAWSKCARGFVSFLSDAVSIHARGLAPFARYGVFSLAEGDTVDFLKEQSANGQGDLVCALAVNNQRQDFAVFDLTTKTAVLTLAQDAETLVWLVQKWIAQEERRAEAASLDAKAQEQTPPVQEQPEEAAEQATEEAPEEAVEELPEEPLTQETEEQQPQEEISEEPEQKEIEEETQEELPVREETPPPIQQPPEPFFELPKKIRYTRRAESEGRAVDALPSLHWPAEAEQFRMYFQTFAPMGVMKGMDWRCVAARSKDGGAYLVGRRAQGDRVNQLMLAFSKAVLGNQAPPADCKALLGTDGNVYLARFHNV